jgi:taurine dioxygenase
MWDNRCTLHIALADYEHTSPRHMLRTTLLGEQSGRIVGDDEIAKIA